MSSIQIPIIKKISNQKVEQAVEEEIQEKKSETEKVVTKAVRTKNKKVEEPVKLDPIETKPQQYHEVSLGLIDLHPQIAKLSQFGTVVYLDLFTTGSTNSSRFEPARSVTVTGKENIQKLADALNAFLATV